MKGDWYLSAARRGRVADVAWLADDHFGNLADARGTELPPRHAVTEWSDDGIALYDEPRTTEHGGES